ncbi:mutator type transposase [Tanacetum coccineum]
MSLNGFKAGKRDLLGLDGCFLSGPYPGQILTAVGVDPNNGIYPLAYAVVEGETKESWLWFLDCLGDDLELFRNSNFTFISDRQKGLIPALQETFPAAEHRYCLKHIYDNMKLQWRGEQYKDLLWRSATATTVQRIEELCFIGNGKSRHACKHVSASIWNMANNGLEPGIPESWVHESYWLKTWVDMYRFKVNPCNGPELWPESDTPITLTAPNYKPPIGRPKKKRRKSAAEIYDNLVKKGNFTSFKQSFTSSTFFKPRFNKLHHLQAKLQKSSQDSPSLLQQERRMVQMPKVSSSDVKLMEMLL